jgi:hypothetical protein
MAEIKRQKGRAQGPGMTSPLGFDDAAAGRAMSEAQAAIEDLYGRLNRLKSGTGAEAGSEFDDTALKREIRNIRFEIEAMWRRIKALERKFPIFRQARVKEVFDDYLECVFYNPVTDIEGAAVNVAKPWHLRVSSFDGLTIDLGGGITYTYAYTGMYERTRTDQDSNETTEIFQPPYFVDDQILIAKTAPGVLDGGAVPIQWEDLNSAGRGWAADVFEWIEADTFYDLPPDAPDGSWGRCPHLFEVDDGGIPNKSVKNGLDWVCLTHMV